MSSFLHVCPFSLSFFQKKSFLRFVYSPVFLNMILFFSLSWTSVSPLFLHFYCPFSIFWGEDYLCFDYHFLHFSNFTYSIFSTNMIFWILSVFTVSFFLKKETVFLICCSFSYFQRVKSSLVFSLSSCFSLLQKKLFFHWKIVFTQFVTSFFFTLFTFLTQKNLFNIFPFRMSFLPLYFLHLFLLYRRVVFFCLSVFSRFFHLFSPFLNFFFLVFYCRIVFSIWTFLHRIYFCILVKVCKTLFFLFPFSTQKTKFSLFPLFGWTFLTFICAMFCLFFCLLKNGFWRFA